MVKTLAWELAPIRVNAIHPGIVGDSPYWEGKPPAILEGHTSKTITKKLATMDEIVAGDAVPARERVGRRGRPRRRQRPADVLMAPESRVRGRTTRSWASGCAPRGRRAALSLRELAGRLGVSPSLISQIETGRANPSVSTLYALAAELDVSLDELMFNDRRQAALTAAEPPRSVDEVVQPAASRKRIHLASGVEWERLTARSERDVEFLFVTYEVGGASSAEGAYQRHSGHEWGYVLEGRLDVRIGFEDYILEPRRRDLVRLDDPAPAGERGRQRRSTRSGSCWGGCRRRAGRRRRRSTTTTSTSRRHRGRSDAR